MKHLRFRTTTHADNFHSLDYQATKKRIPPGMLSGNRQEREVEGKKPNRTYRGRKNDFP